MANIEQAGRAILGLYRSILKIHRLKLPPPMRQLGDTYVGDEFRAHLLDPKKKPTAEQLSTFTTEWTRYRDMLSGTADTDNNQPTIIAASSTSDSLVTGIRTDGSLNDEVLNSLSPEQQQRLALLQKRALEFGSTSDTSQS